MSSFSTTFIFYPYGGDSTIRNGRTRSVKDSFVFVSCTVYTSYKNLSSKRERIPAESETKFRDVSSVIYAYSVTYLIVWYLDDVL